MLMFDGLESLNSRWMLVHALEVPDKHGIYLFQSVD
jgi:hypothetical protein